MEPVLEADGTVRLLGQALTAADVSNLIEELSHLRAQMQPPVIVRWGTQQEVAVEPDPAFKVGLVEADCMLLALRHPGKGWCCFDFSLAYAANLRDFIARHTAGIKASGLDEQLADRSTPKH